MSTMEPRRSAPTTATLGHRTGVEGRVPCARGSYSGRMSAVAGEFFEVRGRKAALCRKAPVLVIVEVAFKVVQFP